MTGRFVVRSALLLYGMLGFACDEAQLGLPGSTDPGPGSSPLPPSSKAAAPSAEAKLPGARPLAPDFPRSPVKELPVAEDFEEEASESLALENLEAELDRLEAEIASLPN